MIGTRGREHGGLGAQESSACAGKEALKVESPSTSAGAAADEVKLTLPQKAKALAGALPPAYWQALTVVGLLYFARFDASFITL